MKLIRTLLVGALAIGPGACALSAANSQAIIKNLTTILNTAQADLNTAILVANAASPPDVDGAACAKALIALNASMIAVMAATPAGATVGVFTAAEVASLYAPGSAQFNQVVKTVETGCIAKLHDINQAGASTIGMPAAIAAALAIAAAPAGA